MIRLFALCRKANRAGSARGGVMKVIRAEVMGMCFGVRDALKIIGQIGDPTEVTIHGELVHNETVLRQIEASGFATTDERNRRGVPETPTVLITAHGISDR